MQAGMPEAASVFDAVTSRKRAYQDTAARSRGLGRRLGSPLAGQRGPSRPPL